MSHPCLAWVLVALLLVVAPGVVDTISCTQYNNTKTADHPETATHALERADFIIGTDADFGDHSHIKNGVLGGFDVELTTAVCAHLGKTCAVTLVPWQSVWASDYARFGWASNPKYYPGEGHHSRWFHCVVGTHRLQARQQSMAFTHPYTDSARDTAGFVALAPAASGLPEDAAHRTVGVIQAWVASAYFDDNISSSFNPADVVWYPRKRAVWAALVAGEIDAAFVDGATARSWLSSHPVARYLHPVAGWSGGVSYQCHPEYGDIVTALNHGLVAFKASLQYAALCARYPGVNCDTSGLTFANTKTPVNPEIADHPKERADIVIGTEADFGDHNSIRNGVLGGFDIELTKAVCAQMGKTCAIVTVPWQSMWTSDYSRFGWPNNQKNYPGEGHQRRWFHCSVGLATASCGSSPSPSPTLTRTAVSIWPASSCPTPPQLLFRATQAA